MHQTLAACDICTWDRYSILNTQYADQELLDNLSLYFLCNQCLVDGIVNSYGKITLHANRGACCSHIGLLFILTTFVMLLDFMAVILSFDSIWAAGDATSNSSNTCCKTTTTNSCCSASSATAAFWAMAVDYFGGSWNASTATVISKVSASSTSVEIVGIPFPVATMMHEQLHTHSSRRLEP